MTEPHDPHERLIDRFAFFADPRGEIAGAITRTIDSNAHISKIFDFSAGRVVSSVIGPHAMWTSDTAVKDSPDDLDEFLLHFSLNMQTAKRAVLPPGCSIPLDNSYGVNVGAMHYDHDEDGRCVVHVAGWGGDMISRKVLGVEAPLTIARNADLCDRETQVLYESLRVRFRAPAPA